MRIKKSNILSARNGTQNPFGMATLVLGFLSFDALVGGTLHR
jgi:hypothetical protein